MVQNIYNAVTYSPKQSLLSLCKSLQHLLQHRNNKLYITLVQSHTSLPGPIAYGNAQVDKLVAFITPEEDHALYHSNAGHLHVQYKIPYRQAKQIVKDCPVCHPMHLHIVPSGINPRGLSPNELWQMDVTHVAAFGRSSYVHVTIDTYSKFLWATALPRECTQHVIQHLFETFAIMGVPANLKTDN